MTPSGSGIVFNDKQGSVNGGTLTATITPDNATDKSVTWKSSDTNIATVDANGKVIAVGVSTTTITVKTEDGEFTATCEVTVSKATPTMRSRTSTPKSTSQWMV